MKIRFLTPVSSEEHEADAVFLPGAAGPFEVLRGHAPIISGLVAGKVRWRDAEGEHSLDITSGAVRVLKDEILICAER